VTLAVVDPLESVDVYAGERKRFVFVPGAVHLLLERDHSQLATKGAGERVKLSALQLLNRPRAILRGGSAIPSRPLTIGGRTRTHLGGPCPRRFGSQVNQPSLSLCSRLSQVALISRPIVRRGTQIAQLRGLITRHRPVVTGTGGPPSRSRRRNALSRSLHALRPRGLINRVLFTTGQAARLLAVLR